jgi:hypothetical protein
MFAPDDLGMPALQELGRRPGGVCGVSDFEDVGRAVWKPQDGHLGPGERRGFTNRRHESGGLVSARGHAGDPAESREDLFRHVKLSSGVLDIWSERQ